MDHSKYARCKILDIFFRPLRSLISFSFRASVPGDSTPFALYVCLGFHSLCNTSDITDLGVGHYFFTTGGNCRSSFGIFIVWTSTLRVGPSWSLCSTSSVYLASALRVGFKHSGTSLMNSGSSLATATLQYLRLCSWWKGGSTLAWHGKVVGFCGLERWFYHGMAWEGGWLLPMGLSFAVLQCPEKVITVTMQANISSLDTYLGLDKDHSHEFHACYPAQATSSNLQSILTCLNRLTILFVKPITCRNDATREWQFNHVQSIFI